MLRKLFSSFSLGKALVAISGISLVAFAGVKADVIKSFIVDRDFVSLEMSHADGKYNLNEQALFRIVTKKTPSNLNYRLYFQAYVNDTAVVIDNAQSQMSVFATITDYIPYVFKVDVYLEDGKRIDAFTSSLTKVNEQIDYITDLIANGSIDESLPVELARLNTLKTSLSSQILKYRKLVEEKTITATVNDLRPRVSFATAAETLDLAQGNNGSLTIYLDKPSDQVIMVPYTVGGTAAGPSSAKPDHYLQNGSVGFQPGQTSKTLPLTLVSSNSGWPKTVVVTLGTPSGPAVLGQYPVNTETVVYTNEPGVPTISSGTYYLDSDHVPNVVTMSVSTPQVSSGRTIQTMHFNFGDGTSVDIPYSFYNINQAVRHVYPVGTYTATVTATDSAGATSAPVAINVVVVDGVRPTPKITATIDPDNQTVHFSAADSQISNGSALTEYRWLYGDNSAEQRGLYVTRDHSYAISPNKSYTVRLRIIDDRRFRSQTYMTVSFDATGQLHLTSAPSANFTVDHAVGSAPLTVNFDGTGSFDINGKSISNIYWNFDDIVSYESVRPGLTTSHTFKRPGTYVVSMTVVNSDGNTRVQYIPIFVTGAASQAASAQMIYMDAGAGSIYFDTDQLSLTGLVDPSYMSWDFGDGSAKTYWRYANHSYSFAQGSTIQKTVNLQWLDMNGNYLTKSQAFTFHQDGQYPVGLVNLPTLGKLGDELSFDASGVSGANPLSYRWDFGDQSNLTNDSAQISHHYDVMGIYQPSVLVIDQESKGTRFSGLITINDASGGNSINPQISANPSSGSFPLTVSFDGSLTTESAQSAISEYYWNFGDVSVWPQIVSTGVQVSYTFNNPGTYIVTLFVKDINGNVNMINKFITVNASRTNSPNPVGPPPGYNGREGCYEVNGHMECYTRPGDNN